MYQYKWTSVTITTNEQANKMWELVRNTKPNVGAFDTETTGLHIIKDKPFLFAFGFINPNENTGCTYVVDIQKQPHLASAVIKAWQSEAHNFKTYLAHNVKFDLHMMENIGLPYTGENLSDTMHYIRFAHDAVALAKGGPPLKLKDYATRYVDSSANYYSKRVDKCLASKAKELNLKLKLRLKALGQPPECHNAKSYTLKVIEEMFKDCTIELEDIPQDVREHYVMWLNEDVPDDIELRMEGCLVTKDDVPYTYVPRALLTQYAHFDIIECLEVYLKTAPVVRARENTVALECEDKLILPFFEMERVGFKPNIHYLSESRKKLKAYIKERREVLYTLGGIRFSIGQHALIKDILNSDFDLEVTSTDSKELAILLSKLYDEPNRQEVIEFIKTLQEIRTLEKWYSAYIMRFVKNLRFSDRLYTSINQVGAVSGRVTSDFQQFPKAPIRTIDGEELFHPRKIIVAEPKIVFIDYSQIELRLQALYTILVGEPDLNLCRAYMPYKCRNSVGELFDYENPKHVSSWSAKWYLEEDPNKMWEPTDVHGATTTEATGLRPGDEGFKQARSEIGKRTNFAKNYGGTLKVIKELFPDKTLEECKVIDAAYYKAFPGVRAYQSYCYRTAQECAYAVNLFGIKYYGVNGHNLINMLMQGSAAYLLKYKIAEIYEYLKPYGTKMQMQVHDELFFKYDPKDPPEIFLEIKKIMETWGDTLVPIVAEMEITETTWAEKKEIESIYDL